MFVLTVVDHSKFAVVSLWRGHPPNWSHASAAETPVTLRTQPLQLSAHCEVLKGNFQKKGVYNCLGGSGWPSGNHLPRKLGVSPATTYYIAPKRATSPAFESRQTQPLAATPSQLDNYTPPFPCKPFISRSLKALPMFHISTPVAQL